MFAPDRREFALTFGAEHVQSSQTYASDAAPSAEPEEEELALVRLGAQEDNFAVNIVDLALMAAQNNERDLERTVLDLVTGNVKTAVKVNNNVDRLESLAPAWRTTLRLRTAWRPSLTPTRPNSASGQKRAWSFITTNTNPAKATAATDKRELIKKF